MTKIEVVPPPGHTTAEVEALAAGLYEAYHRKWYGGASPQVPPWQQAWSKDVWRSRAAALLPLLDDLPEDGP